MADTAEAMKDQGNMHFRKKEYDEAINFYTKGIALDSAAHVCYSNRAAAYLALGRFQEALADGESCIRVKPDFLKGHFRKGTALSKLERYDEAVRAFREGVKVAPDNQEIKNKLSDTIRLQEADGEKKKNETSVDAAGAKAKGNVYFKEGRFEEAIECYTEALQLADGDDPNKAVYHLNRAACYLQLRRFEEVVKDCDRCLKLDATNVKALMRRAMAYDGMDKPEKALADYKAAARLNPGDINVSKNIHRITKALEMQKEMS